MGGGLLPAGLERADLLERTIHDHDLDEPVATVVVGAAERGIRRGSLTAGEENEDEPQGIRRGVFLLEHD